MRDDPRKDAKFNGTIPEMYDRLLGPLLFEPFAIDLARRVGSLKPQNVLEVAAGTGIVTREMLKTLPRNSRLSVTDLNDPMVDYARRQVGEDARVSWRQADAMELPFDDGGFDAVVCQFGIMFFPDKPLGMHEFHRVLSVGGNLLLSVWDSLDRNPPGAIIHTALAEIFPEDRQISTRSRSRCATSMRCARSQPRRDSATSRSRPSCSREGARRHVMRQSGWWVGTR